MQYLAQPAFVLHARPYRETSLLLEVLSRDHGRIGLIARGVRGPRRQVLRAALQPLQSIVFDAVQRGELAQLRAAEAVDAVPPLQGDAALSAFYVNELTLRLAPRMDPLPALFEAYAVTRLRLGQGGSLAWTLRRYERDLLDALGVGLPLDHDGGGDPIDPAARYLLDPEHGPRRLRDDRIARTRCATGSALLALAADRPPEASDLTSLREPLRGVLLHHLGGHGLKSWEMLASLRRVERPGSAA